MVEDVLPFLYLALALGALVVLFWFVSRAGHRREQGYAAAENLRSTHVAVLATSVTVRAVLGRMLTSAGIPFTFVDISKGVAPFVPDEAQVAVLNVQDLRSAGVLIPAISSQRPAVCLVRPFSAEDRELPAGEGKVLLSKPFTAPALFLALAQAKAPASCTAARSTSSTAGTGG